MNHSQRIDRCADLVFVLREEDDVRLPDLLEVRQVVDARLDGAAPADELDHLEQSQHELREEPVHVLREQLQTALGETLKRFAGFFLIGEEVEVVADILVRVVGDVVEVGLGVDQEGEVDVGDELVGVVAQGFVGVGLLAGLLDKLETTLHELEFLVVIADVHLGIDLDVAEVGGQRLDNRFIEEVEEDE